MPGQAPVNLQYPRQRSLEAANFEAGGRALQPEMEGGSSLRGAPLQGGDVAALK